MSLPRPDDELLSEVLRERGEGKLSRRGQAALGELCERWKRPACFVIRRIQASYGRGTPDDELELFQDAVRKLVERGLEQYRGTSNDAAATPASLKTFFLRIVKHQAIDHYRAKREELAHEPPAGEEAPEALPAEIALAVEASRRSGERDDAAESYWAAYAALEKDHPNEASVWRLHHHEGVEDHAESAERLGITVANSYKRLSRAQAYLKLYVLEQWRSGQGPESHDE